MVSSLLRMKMIVVGFGSPRNPRRFSPRQSPSSEYYERFSNEDEDEMQSCVFNMQPKKTPAEIFNSSDDEDEMQGGFPYLESYVLKGKRFD